jgi:glycosyltransferase involved in cell wall biosynthesis
VGGDALAMAVVAWTRRSDFDLILSDQEGSGLLLAMMLKMTHSKMSHVMISHYLTPAKKQIAYRTFGAQSHIDCTVCYSTAQEKLGKERLGLTREQVRKILHPADSAFWRPASSHQETLEDDEILSKAGLILPLDARVICSAGLEFRDYPTLIKAAASLPRSTQIAIAASSPWSKRRNTTEDVKIPANVHVVSLKPLQLRALYRRAQAVVIPLYDVDFQAGSLVAYEAMACAKPVVITRTRGQSDIVQENETGFYVPPGDPAAMAEALNRLLNDPELATTMGQNARTVVEGGLNLNTYLNSMAELVREVAARRPSPQGTLPVRATIEEG